LFKNYMKRVIVLLDIEEYIKEYKNRGKKEIRIFSIYSENKKGI